MTHDVSRRVLWLMGALALGLAAVPPARARVFLKPAGQDAAPLRTKALEADVFIRHGVADTRLRLTFANETPNRLEADFLMTLPPGAVVTYFAYWFGDEKVVARVAEKERAAAIYKHITTRMRDPALIEMVDRHTFRARVFPVMPNADLRVEIRSVQALPSDRQGLFYTLPLMDEGGDRTPLDRIKAAITVFDPERYIVTNNLGLPVTVDGGGEIVVIEGENYRPTKDLRVNLAPAPKPLWAALMAAPSGGPNGFFALTLVPDRALKKPSVRITGVRTYDVQYTSSPVPARGALHVFGRYKGHGPSRVSVKDGVWEGSARLDFYEGAEANNPAAKLWAAERIARLSAQAKNRDAVVTLSLRHTIPSKFTSWLAVPKEEMVRYRREKDGAEASVAAAQLVRELDAGRGRGRTARSLRARLSDLSRRLGVPPQSFLQAHYDERIAEVARPLAREELAGRARGATARSLRRRLATLSQMVGADPGALLADHRRNEANGLASLAAGKLAPLIADGRENTPEGRRLRAKVKTMGRIAGPNIDFLTGAAQSLGHGMARSLATAEYTGKTRADAAVLRDRITRIERASGLDPGTLMRQARASYEIDRAYDVSGRLATEIIEERAEGDTARNLQSELDVIRARADIPDDTVQTSLRNHVYLMAQEYGQAVEDGRAAEPKTVALRARIERVMPLADFRRYGVGYNPLQGHLRSRMEGLAYRIVSRRNLIATDVDTVTGLERTLRDLSVAAGEPYAPFIARAEEPYRRDPVLSARAEIIAERRKESPDPKRLAALERSFLALEPKGADYARARVDRIAIEVELNKLDHVESPTSVQAARRTDLARRLEELRARMGDPLIQVEAPADARQVVALMPDGTVKPLMWNAASFRWEARFDIPTWAAEGAYTVTVIVVGKDGARRTMTIRYHVDLTPPSGVGRIALAGAELVLRLELDADADTARVSALLPWGEEVALGSSAAPGRFFSLAPIPADRRGKPLDVTYILTDKAHNRTTLAVSAECDR